MSKALSARIEGGLENMDVTTATARLHHAKLLGALEAAGKQQGLDEAATTRAKEKEKEKPNIVVVVLESTTGTLVTASNTAGVSPWAKQLASR